ncbi:hypothetical protein ACFODL_06380 [Phenylobacterium terrae]|uniref:Uncharacterized protein n=1 Tax=Phenylobacterium terrae TaxID=2665495 RepID=A0ABW4N621_9CAUL
MDLELKPTTGLATGLVIHFAEGTWNTLGAGVAMSEEAFDLVEPLLKVAWPEWSYGMRYGVSEIPGPARRTLLSELLETSRDEGRPEIERRLFAGLAAWLSTRLHDDQAVTILGI